MPMAASETGSAVAVPRRAASVERFRRSDEVLAGGVGSLTDAGNDSGSDILGVP